MSSSPVSGRDPCNWGSPCARRGWIGQNAIKARHERVAGNKRRLARLRELGYRTGEKLYMVSGVSSHDSTRFVQQMFGWYILFSESLALRDEAVAVGMHL